MTRRYWCAWLYALLAMPAVSLVAETQDTRPSFEVASVKRATLQRFPPLPSVFPGGRFHHAGATVAELAQFAYGLMAFQLIGGPDWIRQDRFAVDATAGAQVPIEQIRMMVQSLLIDRFGLVTRTERREMPHAALVMARDGRPGPALVKCDDSEKPLPAKPLLVARGGVPLTGSCRPISSIAAGLAPTLGTPIIDATRLAGLWNYQLVFAPAPGPLSNDSRPALDNAVSLPVALQEQLGLKLESVTGPLDVLVIESVQPPTEN